MGKLFTEHREAQFSLFDARVVYEQQRGLGCQLAHSVYSPDWLICSRCIHISGKTAFGIAELFLFWDVMVRGSDSVCLMYIHIFMLIPVWSTGLEFTYE